MEDSPLHFIGSLPPSDHPDLRQAWKRVDQQADTSLANTPLANTPLSSTGPGRLLTQQTRVRAI
jgi:hypothetical protein